MNEEPKFKVTYSSERDLQPRDLLDIVDELRTLSRKISTINTALTVLSIIILILNVVGLILIFSL